MLATGLHAAGLGIREPAAWPAGSASLYCVASCQVPVLAAQVPFIFAAMVKVPPAVAVPGTALVTIREAFGVTVQPVGCVSVTLDPDAGTGAPSGTVMVSLPPLPVTLAMALSGCHVPPPA